MAASDIPATAAVLRWWRCRVASQAGALVETSGVRIFCPVGCVTRNEQGIFSTYPVCRRSDQSARKLRLCARIWQPLMVESDRDASGGTGGEAVKRG
jgi:hypothetical protein